MKYISQEDALNKLALLVKAKGSQEAVSQELGVSVQYVNSVLKGNKPPSKKVLNALGLKKVTVYERFNGSGRNTEAS